NLQIDVIADDERIVAAQLEVHFLNPLGGKPCDSSSGRHTTGKCDHVRVPMRNQGFTRFLPIAGDYIYNSLWQVLKSNFSQQQSRKRRVFGWLDDDGVTGSKRGRSLPGHQQQ